MNASELTLILAAVLGGGTVTGFINAIVQRRKIGADATVMVVAAARELVDPLRKELAQEREDHSREIAVEKKKVVQLRVEMDGLIKQAERLRGELALARVEADELRRDREMYRAMVREQERELIELREVSGNPEGLADE